MDEMIEAEPEAHGFLDAVGARILAVLIAAIAGFLLLLSHQYYQGTSGGILGGVDKTAFEDCVDERLAAFGKLADQAGFDAERRAAAERAARTSADVVCAEQARPINR